MGMILLYAALVFGLLFLTAYSAPLGLGALALFVGAKLIKR